MLKRKRTDSYRKQQPYSLWGMHYSWSRLCSIISGVGYADLNPYSTTKNRKEEIFEAKEGLRITVSDELELHGQEAMLKWQFCAAFFFLPGAFHIHPVKKIAFKGFPSTQTRRPSQPPFLQKLRVLALNITSTVLGLVLFSPSRPRTTDHFNLFKAEQWTLHTPCYTESPQ